MKTFYSHTFGQKRQGKKPQKPTDAVLKEFVLSKRAALTVWMLAANVCGFQWDVMEWLASKNSSKIEIWPNEIQLYHSSRSKKADFRPEDTGASRMVIGVQKICKSKTPRLLLVPVTLFHNPVSRHAKDYYADENWVTAHQMGLVVDPVAKTYYLLDPSSMMGIFSQRAKIRLAALFKLTGFVEGQTCKMLPYLARSDDEEMCGPWMMYFFASVILNPTMKPVSIQRHMNYKGLLEFLYYVYTTFKWPLGKEECSVYALGDEYPDLAIVSGQTLQDASYGLEPEEFDAIDEFGVHL